MTSPDPRPSLRGAHILITGGGKGLGSAIARRLATDGATVHLASRDQKALTRTAEQIHAGGGGAVPHALDLTSPKSVSTLAAALRSAGHRIDAIVHCAAGPAAGCLAELQPDQIREALDVAITGPLLVTQALTSDLTASELGRVVFVSSLAARQSASGMALYCATKRGVEALAETLHLELRELDIGVGIVSPSFVSAPKLPEGGLQFESASTIAPEAVAEAISYVLTAHSSVGPLRVELRTATNPWRAE